MTKARDLANIANGVPNSLITLDANEIPNLDTAKITTGTFADARISQSSVTQHSTTFDDSKIQQDLMVLALQQATDANKSAYALSNSFIEQFEDGTGIDVHTNTVRDTSNEFIATVGSSTQNLSSLNLSLGKHQSDRSLSTSNWASGSISGITNDVAVKTGSYDGFYVNRAFDLSQDFTIEVYNVESNGNFGGQSYLGYSLLINSDTTKIGTNPTNVFKTDNTGNSGWAGTGNFTTYRNSLIQSSYDTLINASSITNTNSTNYSTSNSTNANGNPVFVTHYDNDGTGRYGFKVVKSGSTVQSGIINTSRNFTSTWTISNVASTGSLLFSFGDASGAETSYYSLTRNGGSLSEYTRETNSFSNATGNFTSVSQTAPATVSKMGIVVLYKNNAGTATLNTDLIAQVSANNGTDYTTVTLTPRGTFSTGINIAVANNVTVTSGTSCKYKISFANQSAGVKETQVHGIGLLY